MLPLWSEIERANEITLYCKHCKSKTAFSPDYVTTADAREFRCRSCKKVIRLFKKDFIQKNSERKTDYNIEGEYKIGQQLQHNYLEDEGTVIGKEGTNAILIDFEKSGIKRLVCNYGNA